MDSDEEKEKPKQIEKQEPQTKVVEKIIER
eukprot:COSAG06_NODE_70511_length_191_cov_132.858696_1_plen_29_part_10